MAVSRCRLLPVRDCAWQEGKLAIENGLISRKAASLVPVRRPRYHRTSAFAGVGWVRQHAAEHFPELRLGGSRLHPHAAHGRCFFLARLSDGVLVVVREGHTRRKVLNKALESVERNKLLGVVFNEVSAQQVSYDRYYGQYGYYGYGKSNGRKSDTEKGKAASA